MARVYFDHVDDYSRTYGHLNSIAMLLLWLYVSNGAILIGGELSILMDHPRLYLGDGCTPASE